MQVHIANTFKNIFSRITELNALIFGSNEALGSQMTPLKKS